MEIYGLNIRHHTYLNKIFEHNISENMQMMNFLNPPFSIQAFSDVPPFSHSAVLYLEIPRFSLKFYFDSSLCYD